MDLTRIGGRREVDGTGSGSCPMAVLKRPFQLPLLLVTLMWTTFQVQVQVR
jgi:hypothetical protein